MSLNIFRTHQFTIERKGSDNCLILGVHLYVRFTEPHSDAVFFSVNLIYLFIYVVNFFIVH